MAPTTVNANVVRNHRVDLRWSIPVAKACTLPTDLTPQANITPEGCPEYVGQFKAAYTGEMGIASDGKYIYTTKYSSTGIINRYTMDGTFDTRLHLGRAFYLDHGFPQPHLRRYELLRYGQRFYALCHRHG